MVLLIDNYDSFSYNLYQMVGAITPDIKVIRNDEMTLEEIKKLAPEYIILSPGPKRPDDAGVCLSVAKELGDDCKILGVCLGHQSICQAYGAKITYAKRLMHGKQSVCDVDNSDLLFKGLDSKITVARYHSLAADESTMPDCLTVTAKTQDGEIMAVKHKTKNIWGVQFHPESIMTPDGQTIIKNFLGGK
ncbi:MAG: aminodeoxychorismate/anthranilate synthase component II [Clostridiales bacterium]|nr:aminodeoxychorismate/anthranilate synthase component II [Clostridiales bacterium]